jgi:hypothetical protein
VTQQKPRLFSTAEAAEYLGIHLETFKYHIYRMKHIEPDYVVGRELAFLQETLDQFRAKHQAKGYTMQEAAEYLGVSFTLLRYHVYNSKKLAPDGKRGNANTFSKETLDQFKREVLKRRSRRK